MACPRGTHYILYYTYDVDDDDDDDDVGPFSVRRRSTTTRQITRSFIILIFIIIARECTGMCVWARWSRRHVCNNRFLAPPPVRHLPQMTRNKVSDNGHALGYCVVVCARASLHIYTQRSAGSVGWPYMPQLVTYILYNSMVLSIWVYMLCTIVQIGVVPIWGTWDRILFIFYVPDVLHIK